MNPRQPGDRDHLETACGETRPTAYPILAHFPHASRVCGNRPRLYTHVCIYSNCCCCAACVHFGALFSGQRRFVFLCCDTRMYLRFRGCPVVLDIELSVSAWYHKTRRVPLRARRLLLLLLTAERRDRWRVVCGITLKLTSNGEETKITILCQSEHQKIPPHPKQPRLKKHFFSSRKSHVPGIC